MRRPIKDFLQQAHSIISSVADDLVRFDILRHAYAMAYVSLLSLVPSLAAIFAILGLFSPMLSDGSNAVILAKDFIFQHLATASGEQAIKYIEQFLGNLDFKKIGITGFAGSLVTLIMLVKHIEVALNKIFQVNKTRPLITRVVNFWTFLTLSSFSLALFIGITSSNLYSGTLGQVASTAGMLVNKLILVSLFSLIYKLVPNCYVSTLWAFSGGILATSLLSIAAQVLKNYIELFSNYKAIYGAALAALPIFLVWLYVIWLIVLLGALFAWRMQHRKAHRDKNSEANLIPRSPYTEAKIRQALPFAIMEQCYKAFEEGNGSGITKAQLAETIEVPLYWLDEFLDLLEDRKLILFSDRDSSEEAIHPKRPRTSLNESELENLLEDSNFHISQTLEKSL